MRLTDEEIIRSLGEDLPVGIWVARAPGGEFVYANRTFAEILGQSGRTDVAAGENAAPYGIHTRTGELYPEKRMPFVQALHAGANVIVDDIVIHRSDGGRVYIRAQARPVRLADGTISHVVIAFIDISREVEAESRLRLVQRMESIGTLASQEDDRDKLEALASIEQAADSGVQLTRTLLGFARRGKNLDSRVSVNNVVAASAQLLQRTIGPNIHIATALSALGEVKGDPSQLEQVVVNLVVNARDAMPDGGEVSLRTSDQDGFVVIEVADTGIDPAVRVLLTTGFASTEEAQRLLDLGVRGFVAKPYDLATLSEALAAVLGDQPVSGGAHRG